jgi:hypothetical protein
MGLAGNRAEVGECCAERRLKSKLNYASHRFGNSIATLSRENLSFWRFSERLQPHWGSLTITASAGSYRQIPQKVLLTRYRGRSTFVLPTPGSVTPFRARSA